MLWVVQKDIDRYLLNYTGVNNISFDILSDLQQFMANSILRHVVDMSVEYVLSFHQPPWQLLWLSTAASKTCKGLLPQRSQPHASVATASDHRFRKRVDLHCVMLCMCNNLYDLD